MDNFKTHHYNHYKEVEKLICVAEAIPLYLPPYSPDLNPIEKMRAKMENFFSNGVSVSGKIFPKLSSKHLLTSVMS